MSWTVRTFALAAGAAALMSAQAVNAAPVRTAPAIDPLVTLSLFGTSQSRAAVCGTGPACAVMPAAKAAAGAPAIAASAVAVQDPRRDQRGKQLPTLALILGFMIAVAIAAALLAGNDDDEPVSPE